MNKRLLVLVGGGLLVLMASTLSAFDFGGGGTSSGSMAVGSAVGSSVHNKVLYTDNTGLLQELTLADGQVPTASDGAIVAGTINAAPTTSKYILQQADAALPNAQALGALASGCLSVTTTTGVVASTACGGAFLQLNATTLLASLDPVSNAFDKDEFCGGNPGALYGSLRWTPAGAASVASPVVAGHPCILQTLSTNSSHTSLFGGVGAGPQISSADTFDQEWIVRPNVNGGTLALSNWRLGFADAAGAPPSNGFYVEKLNADTNWFCVVMNAATPSRTDTTVAVASGTWYRIRIRRIDATHIGCTVNAATEVSNAGTEPSFSMVPFTDNTSSELFSHQLDHDYYHHLITGLTR